MHLADTRIEHEAGGWKIDFIGDDGDAVSDKVVDEHAVSADEALERAKAVMVQLTAYGTGGGGRSFNTHAKPSATAISTTTNRFWTPGISWRRLLPSDPTQNGNLVALL
ncbi:hypothetical protein Rleg_7061 (plasmid) [Rhizobium leguminosarum bv. trifolii WSM1325]|uniref:Uncharacterized protein n=1 Tax=Rhizobium leguminosarum bv. trifolii (strain WSM1325) TaxID=395491 RepID=C6B7L3_RHILS|nr:hypothetical protein Rleg_7061 [Rhizobium leguminosarum bv. trifolii WSM1325]